MFTTGILVHTPHQAYKVVCVNLSLSFFFLTAGTLKQWFPKEDERKVAMASGIEVDEEPLETRSDDDDT